MKFLSLLIVMSLSFVTIGFASDSDPAQNENSILFNTSCDVDFNAVQSEMKCSNYDVLDIVSLGTTRYEVLTGKLPITHQKVRTLDGVSRDIEIVPWQNKIQKSL